METGQMTEDSGSVPCGSDIGDPDSSDAADRSWRRASPSVSGLMMTIVIMFSWSFGQPWPSASYGMLTTLRRAQHDVAAVAGLSSILAVVIRHQKFHRLPPH